MAVGIVALVWGVLAYLDWQWMHEHLEGKGSTHWTSGLIAAKLTNAVLAMAIGALGFVSGVLAMVKVRKALDDDNQDAIKRWSFLTGVLGFIPGAVAGGLLEIFIWRAHAQETFTVFGLLGPSPSAAPDPSAATAAPAFQMDADAARRKAEYESLFSSAPAAPAPDFGYSQEGGYAQPASAYDYGQPTAGADVGYGQNAEAQAAAPAEVGYTAEAGAQYYEQPTGAPICSCGRPMEWVAEYQRYYCYTDDKYEGET
jgi:hypothetical protein